MTEQNPKEILAKRIKEERQKLNWSQGKLAEEIFAGSASTVTNWETAFSSPDYEKLCLMADVFHVSADYLLGRTNKRNSEDADCEVSNHQLDEYERKRIEKMRCCDEIGLASIDNCIDFHCNRVQEEMETKADTRRGKGKKDTGKKPIMLNEDDPDYYEMKEKVNKLRYLKRQSKRSFSDITNYLWDIGYAEVYIVLVMNVFGYGLTPRVPGKELYHDIEEYLLHKYYVVPKSKME